ncbi:MAG: hypothetical protein ACRD0P_07630 [Stackebrandtia sp.]
MKRVPIDLDAPLNEVWPGYVMPNDLMLPQCDTCNGHGRDATFQWLESVATLLLMFGEDAAEYARGRRLHPYLQALTVYTSDRPTPESALQLSTGLAGRAPREFGHDTLDTWSAVRAIIAAAGLDFETWAVCTTCGGKGDLGTDEQRAAYEAWEPTDPPNGEGWQLWETVSEGSPISPAFADADALAAWMSHPDRGRNWVPESVAAKFIAEGWAPTAATGPAGAMSGVEFIGTTGSDDV